MKAATTITRQSDRPGGRSRTASGNITHFHFIGGKGGVGKTTCAAAFALASAASGARVLIVSTDPAPSLGDALKLRLSGSPQPVRFEAAAWRRTRRGTLHAVEIDAPVVLRQWIGERRAVLEGIALHGTWLDLEDVRKLLGLSLPGMDEVAALLEISRLAGSGAYDQIVVDTAPTGHTLRMLAMPETLFGLARLFDSMQAKVRLMVEALRGGWTPGDEDALISAVAAEARMLDGILRDQNRTRVSWVTLPEPMAVAETTDAIDELQERGIVVRDLIVNRVTPPTALKCGHCDARRSFERRAVRNLPALNRLTVEARDAEPRGVGILMRIGRELHTARVVSGNGRTRTVWAASLPGRRADAGGLITGDTRLLLLGGKGGVGKTTCAAAVAIAAARQMKKSRVLLISTDPAHSLADVHGSQVTDQAAVVHGGPSNLLVREIDSAGVFATIRERYAAAIDSFFDRLAGTGSVDIGHDRSVMQGLIDLAPPGLDELAAMIEITDALSPASYDLVVVDTAPTGHALRLLEMPALVHQWTKALMAILLKYRQITRLGEIGALLLRISKGLGRLRELLRDHRRTQFIVVTRAAALPRAETVRLVRRLEELEINVPTILVNAVGRGRCARCRRAHAAERREIAALVRQVAGRRAGRSVVLGGTRVPPPHRPAVLRAWGQSGWRYHQDG